MASESGDQVKRLSTEGQVLPSSIKALVKPGDRPLVVNLQGHHLYQDRPELLRELGFSVEPETIPFIKNQLLSAGLRDSRVDVASWETAVSELSDGVSRVVDGIRGALHVFAAAPYPAGMLLGRLLWEKARDLPVYIHQYSPRAGAWEPFVFPQALWPGESASNYFGELIQAGSGPGKAVILNIDSGHRVTKEQLESVARQVSAGSWYCQPVAGDAVLRPEQVQGAVKTLLGSINKILQKHRGSPLHLLSSAPLALLIELGRRLPNTVFSQVIVSQYDPSSLGYIPFLDIMRPEVQRGSRPQLEVLSVEQGILLYRLNGRILEGASLDLGGKDGLDRQEPGANSLSHAADLMSEKLLPHRVEERLSSLSALDIDIRVEGLGEDLSWEFLRLGRTVRRFVARQRDWSLVRVLREVSGVAPAYVPVPAEKLKVMIIPALEASDEEKALLDVESLKVQIEATGASVKCLNYGVDVGEIFEEARDYRPHILHWISHGQHDAGRGWDDILEVTRTGQRILIGRERLRQLMLEIAPRLVVLCSCSVGAMQGGFGVPKDLIADGVGAILAFREPVGMGLAADFARYFYQSLLSGARVRDAVQTARIELRLSTERSAGAFGAPILSCNDVRSVGTLVLPRVLASGMAPTALPHETSTSPTMAAQSAVAGCGQPSSESDVHNNQKETEDMGDRPVEESQPPPSPPGPPADSDLSTSGVGTGEKNADNVQAPATGGQPPPSDAKQTEAAKRDHRDQESADGPKVGVTPH